VTTIRPDAWRRHADPCDGAGALVRSGDRPKPVHRMQRHNELGEFLRSCRGRLLPEDVGVSAYGKRRRVPGLRREELAQLAGVSVAYYTRLEQGHNYNASDSVLDALARALRLDQDEHVHLRNLARRTPPTRRSSAAERARPETEALVHAMRDVPAIVAGRSMDILAWNRIGHALLAGHVDYDSPWQPGERPNWPRLFFLDPHLRELFVDWERKAGEIVGYLRLQAGRYPDDPRLAALVGELSVKSDTFATLWSTHSVREKTFNTVRLHHPLVGSLTVLNEILRLPDAPDQLFATFYAEPGSTSEAALRLLADTCSPAAPPERATEPAAGARTLAT
jgi:transcriptional regulator with XRE-family HTH domain